MKKQRQKTNKIIKGKSKSSGGVSGAPEPSRHLFIYRVSKETDNNDLHCFISERKFTVRDLNCISNPDAKFKSFKLSVPMSQYDALFKDDMWPEGIMVRRYIPPKSQSY